MNPWSIGSYPRAATLGIRKKILVHRDSIWNDFPSVQMGGVFFARICMYIYVCVSLYIYIFVYIFIYIYIVLFQLCRGALPPRLMPRVVPQEEEAEEINNK